MLFQGKLSKIIHFYPQSTTKKVLRNHTKVSTDTENYGRKRNGWSMLVFSGSYVWRDRYTHGCVTEMVTERNEEMATERERGEQKRGRHLRSFAKCKCAKRDGKEAAKCASVDERGSRGEGESDGSRQSRRGRECEREQWRGVWAREHALHVMQSVHMALYYAVINASCMAAKAATIAFLSGAVWIVDIQFETLKTQVWILILMKNNSCEFPGFHGSALGSH